MDALIVFEIKVAVLDMSQTRRLVGMHIYDQECSWHWKIRLSDD